MPPRPWGTLELSPEETGAVRIGPRDLWLRRDAGEVWLSHAPVPPEETGTVPGPGPEDPGEWRRWALPGGQAARIRLKPAFPDRTVVVAPEHGFHLVENARTRVYVSVPLFVQVETAGARPHLLEEVPTATLSDTWWGSFMEGELAYWLPTLARTTHGPEDREPHLAVCPLSLANRSRASLKVERLALRVQHLGLFEGDDGFWADETRVLYREEAGVGEVRPTGKPPPEAEGATPVAEPREPAREGIRAKTIGRILGLSAVAPGR